MPELREIESETEEQRAEAQDIALEVEDHRERAEALGWAVVELRQVQTGLDSEGLQAALQDAEEARRATEKRLDTLRERRDDLLRENARMQDTCEDAVRRKHEALDKVHRLKRPETARTPEGDAAESFYARMETDLSADLRRTDDAREELAQVRRDIEALDL